MLEIRTENAPTSPSPISQAVQAGDYLFVSGQTPRRPDGTEVAGDFDAEVRCVLSNVIAVVEAAGAGAERVCKVNAYLTDASLFERFNAIYSEYFTSAPLPARTTIVSSLARPSIRVEVEAVAWLG